MSCIIECIKTVGRGERGRKPLTFDQAYQVMDEYLDGQIDDDQMAMLLMLIRVQNETKAEIGGFVKAFQSRMPDIGAEIDWPCYAGKRASTGKPWHLIAAKILADNGHKTLLHGYHENSGREHAEDYLSEFNIQQAQTADEAAQLLASDNIAYLRLHNFAPQAEKMIAWKARYGLRTPINTVVRALNPGNAKVGIRGSFHPGFQQLHAEVEDEIGLTSHAVLSFKGVSGEAEYNPKVSQTVWLSRDSQVEELYWPACYSDDLPLPKKCILGTPEEDMLLMANTVVATLTAVLFTLELDREKALVKAQDYWRRYIAG